VNSPVLVSQWSSKTANWSEIYLCFCQMWHL